MPNAGGVGASIKTKTRGASTRPLRAATRGLPAADRVGVLLPMIPGSTQAGSSPGQSTRSRSAAQRFVHRCRKKLEPADNLTFFRTTFRVFVDQDMLGRSPTVAHATLLAPAFIRFTLTLMKVRSNSTVPLRDSNTVTSAPQVDSVV